MRKTALTLSAATLLVAAVVSGVSAHGWGAGAQQRHGWMMDPESAGPWMMGPGMMGGGMMGHGMSHMMMIMMDSDGDSAVSQEEYQALHARMFEAMDLNSDGKLSSDEMQEFMWSGAPASETDQ